MQAGREAAEVLTAEAQELGSGYRAGKANFKVVRHPDDFVLDLADLEPGIVIGVAHQQRAARQHPPFTAQGFIDCLRRQGLPGVAGFLEGGIDLI